jgi:hypothetical protein
VDLFCLNGPTLDSNLPEVPWSVADPSGDRRKRPKLKSKVSGVCHFSRTNEVLISFKLLKPSVNSKLKVSPKTHLLQIQPICIASAHRQAQTGCKKTHRYPFRRMNS